MASLWEIDERLMNYQMEFDKDGVWINEDEWESIKMDKTEKIKNTVRVIENKMALRDAIKAKEKDMDERVKTLNKEIDTLKRRVGASLNYEKFETDEVKITFIKSTALIVTDESKIPERFLKEETKVKFDKDAAKKWYKDIQGTDEECDWATLEIRHNMQIK